MSDVMMTSTVYLMIFTCMTERKAEELPELAGTEVHELQFVSRVVRACIVANNIIQARAIFNDP